MNKWVGFFVVASFLLFNFGLNAATEPGPVDKIQETEEPSILKKIEENFGLDYFSVLSGPGLGQSVGFPPGMNGAPSDTGLNFFNYISVKYKATEKIAIDLQFRTELVVTNRWEYRHQGQRLGISGKLLSGSDWKLTGAVNTDVAIPYIMGQINQQRTLLFDPGMFSFFSYTPTGTRWSVFALLAPRVWFYRDRQALAVQDVLSGGAVSKPEIDLYLEPSINYALTDKTGLRLGTTLEWTKFVGFSSLRRNYAPIELGVTHEFSPAFSLYTYLLSSTPLDNDLRRAQGFGNNPWWKSLSINMWLSGTLF